MGTCSCNPEIDTPYQCMKHMRYLCDDCLDCPDPELYCKNRPACAIWMIRRERLRESRRAAAETGIPSGAPGIE